MEPDFRRSMSWLHTWAGLVLGGVLFAIFWMGTLSVFDKEIDLWMKPATRMASSDHAFSFDAFRSSLEEASRLKASFWAITLPNERDPVLHIRLRVGARFHNHDVDPSTGRDLPDPGTFGASGFIYPFHYSLRFRLGEWLVGLAGMAMLVLCVSGIVIHRKIFVDFFTFRPEKKPGRMLLDLHNVAGVLGLPFHIALTFSGLVIFGAVYFPSGTHAVCPHERACSDEDIKVSLPTPSEKLVVPFTSLDAVAVKARSVWGHDFPESIIVFNPGTSVSRIRVLRSDRNQVVFLADKLVFDPTDGHLLSRQPPLRPIARTERFLAGLHLIRFQNWPLRWLYFASGLGSCVMIATGFFFWLNARRKKQGVAFGFRLVEGMAAGSVTGIVIATLAFFVANRLLPLGVNFAGYDRAALEVWAFYFVWLATFAHGWLRPRRVWIEQSVTVGGFALGGVLLNWLTTSDPLWRTFLHRYLWPVAGMDTLLLLGGGLAFWTGISLARRARETAYD